MALASPKLKLPNAAEQLAFRCVDQILRSDPVLQTTVKAWRSWTGAPEDILDPTFATCPYLRISSNGVDIVGNHNPVLPGSKVQNLGVARCRQAEVSKPRELGCRLAAQYAHGNRVIQIIVSQEAWPAHGDAGSGTLWSARRRCTTALGFSAAR
jgi:hypothetical protein